MVVDSTWGFDNLWLGISLSLTFAVVGKYIVDFV